MRLADQYLLAQIREKLLSHIPDDQWKLVEDEVEKAGGVRHVGGYTGVLLTDAITKASFGGDRSAAGRYAAEQRWKGHQAGSGTGKQDSDKGADNIKSADLSDLADMIVRDLKSQGKQVPAAAKPYLDAMRTMGSINENYGMDSGASIVGYLLSNLSQYKGETARLIKAELRSRLKNQRLSDMEPNPNRRDTTITASPMGGDTQIVLSEPKGSANSFGETDFPKGALSNLKDNPTYKAGVAARKNEIKRGSDGVARFRGSDLKSARESLQLEEDSLELFESGRATSRRILGSSYNKTDTRAILQARIASARANVQALEEFEDETSPGFFSS